MRLNWHLGTVPKDRQLSSRAFQILRQLDLKPRRLKSNTYKSAIFVAQNQKEGSMNTQRYQEISIGKSDKEKTNSHGRCLAVSLLRNQSGEASSSMFKNHRSAKPVSDAGGCASHSRVLGSFNRENDPESCISYVFDHRKQWAVSQTLCPFLPEGIARENVILRGDSRVALIANSLLRKVVGTATAKPESLR